MNAWLLLAISIVAEISGTLCLKFSNGMTRLTPALGVIAFYTTSFWIFSLAVRRLDLAVSYAIWAAVGTAGISILSVLLFGEQMTTLKIVSLVLIVVGVIGLNVASGSSAH